MTPSRKINTEMLKDRSTSNVLVLMHVSTKVESRPDILLRIPDCQPVQNLYGHPNSNRDPDMEEFERLGMLLEQALKGCNTSIQQLAIELDTIITRIVMSRTQSWRHEDREDLIQEVLLHLFKNDMKLLRGLEHPKTLLGWVKSVTFRKLVDVTRKWRRLPPSVPIDAPISDDGRSRGETIPSDDPTVCEQICFNRLIRMVPFLKDRVCKDELDLVIFEMGMLNDLQPAEIAAITHTTVQKVYTRKFRLRQAIRALLAKWMEQGDDSPETDDESGGQDDDKA